MAAGLRFARNPRRSGSRRCKRGRQSASSGLVHEFHAWRMGQPAGSRRVAMGRQILRGHGAGAGARVLRLHHDRGHADGVRGVWRQRGGRVETCAAGAEARSDAARCTDRGGDLAPWRRRHNVHLGLSAVHAGASLLDAGPHRRWAFRLEHRHFRRGHRGAELWPRQAAAP